MKRFLLALAVLAIVSLHSAFSADGSFASPYDLGLINGSAYFSMSGLTVGQAAKYYSFGIYTTAPAGATMDVAFVSPTGDPMYVLALYSGSTKILSGKFVTTDGSNYLSQVTLVSPLVSGEYLLQVGEAGSAIGTTGSAFTIDFNLQNYSAPAVLHAPINQSPANGAVDCATTSLLLQATPYSQNNTTGYAVTTEWVMRRTTDNAVVLNATVSGGADSVHVTDLVPGRRYSWQVRYANETNAWTPFSTPTVFTAATVWPPQISVSTINALAVEAPLYQGVVRVSRTTTTGARTVKLKIGGTALPGVDYQTIPASLTIPAGAHFVDIPIVPTGTSAFVGKQSVTIAAQAVTGFAVQSSPAVLSIRSNLLPQRLVVREGNSYLFDLTGTGGTPGKSVVFGNGREKVLYGDFTGAGADTLLLNSGTTYSLALGVSGSVSAQTFHFGPSGKQTPFIADYDGNCAKRERLSCPAARWRWRTAFLVLVYLRQSRGRVGVAFRWRPLRGLGRRRTRRYFPAARQSLSGAAEPDRHGCSVPIRRRDFQSVPGGPER